MEPVSIPNFAPAAMPGAVPSASVPQVPRGGPTAQSGDSAIGIPPFAQIVREVLEKTAIPGNMQPALTSQPSARFGPSLQKTESVNPEPVSVLPAPDPIFSNLLSPAPKAAQLTTAAAKVPASSDASSQNQPAKGKSAESNCSGVISVAPPPPAALPSLASLVSAGFQPTAVPINTPTPPEPQSQKPATSDGAATTPICSARTSSPGAISVESASVQTAALPLPATESAPSVKSAAAAAPSSSVVVQANVPLPSPDVSSTAPEQGPVSAVPPVQPPPIDGQKLATELKPARFVFEPLMEEMAASKFSGVPVSAVLQQISELQDNVQPAVSFQAAHSPLPSPAVVAESATKATIAATPFFAAHPAQFASMVSNTQPKPVATDQSTASQAAPSAAAINHTDSQDKSSNHGGQNQGSSSGSQESSSPANDALPQPENPAFAATLAAASAEKAPAPAPVVVQPPPAPSDGTHIDHSVADSASTPESAATNPTPSLPAPEAAANRFVSSAQISQASDHSEMRIAVQTDKLGAVELRARVAGDEVGAAITVEKRDAHAALAVELPALQQALSEKQLRVEQLSLLQGAPHSTAGNAGSQSQAQQGHRSPQRSQSASSLQRLESSAAFVPAGVLEAGGIFDSQGRLSVRA